MNMKTIAVAAIIIVVLGAGYALARPGGGFWNGMMGSYGNGYGMMGYGNGMMGNFWNGMTGGYAPAGGMMGYGGGMMGAGAGSFCGGYGAGYETGGTPITIENAKEAAEKYLASTGNTDLALTEVMEFENNFYAEVKEKSTGVHAFELLVDRYTGAVFPEPGPNMMWNTKYGHMGWNAQSAPTVTEEQALKDAQAYLDRALPGTKADGVDKFYGYYTIHVQKDGGIYGMLSVNGYTGAVWYHGWHGGFVKILEVE